MSSHGSSLAAITKQLSLKWQQTRESWQDAKSLEFEQKYMNELQPAVDKTVTVIEQLDKLVAKIKSDCE